MAPLPVFPLPNVVFFPGSIQPLHIFEERYREMMKDALKGERKIAMALLKPGWEEDYYGRPDFFETVTVGSIESCDRLPDGRYNLMLKGLYRAAVVKIDDARSYRRAELAEIEERIADEHGLRELLDSVKARFRELSRAAPRLVLPAAHLDDSPVGRQLDLIASALNIAPSVKQEVLEKSDVFERAVLIMSILEEVCASVSDSRDPDGGSGGFPGVNLN